MGLDPVKLFQRRPPPSRKQIRKLKPVRNPAVAFELDEGGGIMLKVPLTHAKPFLRALAKLSNAPAEKQVELEPVGAAVWRMCDGKHTIEMIAKSLSAQFGLTPAESEASLLAFLDTLSKRRYLTWQNPQGK
jgi:hypothetical protein